MAEDNTHYEVPLFRYRRSIEVTIDMCKREVVRLHQEAATLSGRRAKELREIADDLDDYAESLKLRLKVAPGFPTTPGS